MLFHTWPFLLFLLIVLPVCFALRKTWLWLPWLTVASYFFYRWWNPYYLLLVVYSTVLDFCLVALMDHCTRAGRNVDVLARLTRLRFDNRVLKVAFVVSTTATLGSLGTALVGPQTLRPTMVALGLIVLLMALGALYSSRRIWLLISVVNNLALLLFFKYARFFVEYLIAVFSSLHASVKLSDPSLRMPFGFEYLLPVGISFFTFQSLSYTIDFYLGNVQRERNLLRFATFVCFFPQLMAGPIERARHLLPQFHQFPPVRLQNFTDGASLFLVGLFKKLALANYLAFYVERVYDNPRAFGAPTLMLATFAFAWQIFFDFSGYTDMARGVAKFMGFNLILNFNNPYLATGLGEFVFVCFAWIFFRAGSLGNALLIVNRIFTATWHDPQIPALMLVLVAVVWLYQFCYESRLREILQTDVVRVGVAVSMVLYLCLCASGGGAFIYFSL